MKFIQSEQPPSMVHRCVISVGCSSGVSPGFWAAASPARAEARMRLRRDMVYRVMSCRVVACQL